VFYQRDFKEPEKDQGRWQHDRWEAEERSGDRAAKSSGGSKGSRKGREGKRKYDARDSEQNHPYAHLAFGQVAAGVPLALSALVLHRTVWLVDHGFEKAALVVDSAAEASIFVVDAVADSVAEVSSAAVHRVAAWIGTLCLFVITWYTWHWVLKCKLRLSGKEPEANVSVFKESDVWAVVRSHRKVPELLNRVRLDSFSSDGHVLFSVQGRELTPYVVALDWSLVNQGRGPAEVVVRCSCMDHLNRGPVCKHAGAACLHLLRSLPAVELLRVEGPPLASAALVPEVPGAVRRALALRAQAPAVGVGCLAGLEALRSKAKELQARAFLRASTVPVQAVRKATKSVSVQTEGVRPTSTFLTAEGAQRYTQALLIGDADEIRSVDFVAYSLDAEGVVEALAALGPKVRVLMDSSQCFGRTKKQLQAAQKLACNGCAVRVGTGVSVREAYAARDRHVNLSSTIKGIVHGKSALVRFDQTASRGAVCVIGSTNWTDSSTANLEFSAVLRDVGEEFEEAWCAEFARGWASGDELAEAIVEADRRGYGQRSASRSMSVTRGRG